MEHWSSEYHTATLSQLPKHFLHQTYYDLVDTEEYDVHDAIRASRIGYKKAQNQMVLATTSHVVGK